MLPWINQDAPCRCKNCFEQLQDVSTRAPSDDTGELRLELSPESTWGDHDPVHVDPPASNDLVKLSPPLPLGDGKPVHVDPPASNDRCPEPPPSLTQGDDARAAFLTLLTPRGKSRGHERASAPDQFQELKLLQNGPQLIVMTRLLRPNVLIPLPTFKSPPVLKLLLTNAFGLSSKLGEFQHVLALQGVDVATVTETKFTSEKITLVAYSFPGYLLPPLCLDCTAQGGGVAVWVKSGLAAKHLNHIPCHDHEVIWLRVTLESKKNIVLCALYRLGSCSESNVQLLEYFHSSLDLARLSGHRIIAGDFNAHNKEWLNSSKTTLAGEFTEDLCIVNGLSQHVHSPTRGSNGLDLILSDFPEGVTTEILPPIGAADHATVIAMLDSLLRSTGSARQSVQCGDTSKQIGLT